ncbi:uncharacterized protein LY89DRAFT_739766 [Mollisia scopiformis]|uniref:Zn(2)-C6 fungal-type domain-containing protein n=1 Tax=Mollisia scopiformis TaxID=149040 RepID=A0A194WS26_MOLSC|nr:uncharacterized protein LY89DRAFT_739766 [Mollisia scopiformis]KUJ10776.1 hypothetical protein LY89DRAFT_739766 [Mollisia scopiformis]
MKRSSEAFEPESGREKVPRRQEPVSCVFCRKKKLKCDRGGPCSNCRARKLECSSASSGAGESSQGQKSFESPQPAASGQNIDELNNRIKKLESLLIAKTTESPPQTLSVNKRTASAASKDEPRGDLELSKTLSFIETDAYEHAPTTSEEQLSSDAKVAESFGSFIFALTRPRSPPAFTQHLPSMLPTRIQGQILLDYYIDHVNWIYQIIHVPTVQKIFDIVYTHAEQNTVPQYGYVALIATIFALSAYFSSPQSNLYFHHSEAKRFSYRWVSLAQDALAASNCLSVPTIEALQSLILISQHLMPNIGAIATLRTLAATSMYTARAMGLHKIDSPANKARRQNTEVDWVDIEVKRRIWWHLASTDWLLSFMSGAQCGTYMIHPKQMNVDHPSNVDDTEINARGDYARPMEFATDMTYFIFRVKFATVFGEMVDAAWEAGSDMDELPFELVLEFDKKLNTLLADFDRKFEVVKHNYPPGTNDSSAGQKLARLSKQRTMARNMAHFGIHTRISRLHRPYLVRGAQDPRYAYSRMVCLRSARTVIELGKKMTTQVQDLASIKIWSVNHHVFVSTVILVMDYCFNRDEPRAKERKEEILECFRILESSREDSTIATRGLQKLRIMLREKASGDASSGDESTGSKASFSKQQRDSPTSFAPPNQFQQAPSTMYQSTPVSGSEMNQLPSQWQWDLGSLDFDVDYSQFEALFQNIDNSREMF